LKTIILAVVSGIILFRFRVNSAWLILAGALLGGSLPHKGLDDASPQA
jgi:hypothetical protein